MSKIRKFIRYFNGKAYIRVYRTTNKKLAESIKANLHSKGKRALIITSGITYQVWTRKGVL